MSDLESCVRTEICYQRACQIKAPFKKGTRLLFIGHNPPSLKTHHRLSADWNDTLKQMQQHMGNGGFAKKLRTMGLEDTLDCGASHKTPMHVANLAPLISTRSEDMSLAALTKDISQRNVEHLRALITSEKFNVIMPGWGRLHSRQMADIEDEILSILLKISPKKTLILCASNYGAGWFVGHPNKGTTGKDGDWIKEPLRSLKDYQALHQSSREAIWPRPEGTSWFDSPIDVAPA